MYYGTGTVDNCYRAAGECSGCRADAACAQCTHKMAALFCTKWRHGRLLDRTMTSRQNLDSVSRCYLVESYQFSTRSDLKQQSHRLLRDHPNKKKKNSKNNNKMNSDPETTSAQSLTSFRRHLKTWLFSQSYPNLIIWSLYITDCQTALFL